MINDFKFNLRDEGKSINTVNSYLINVKGYLKWFNESFDKSFTKLFREDVLEFISFLINVKKFKATTINAKIAALVKFNEYLIKNKIQDNIVITKKDYVKVQN